MKVLVTGADGMVGKALRHVSMEYPEFNFIFSTRKDTDLIVPNQVEKLLSDHSWNPGTGDHIPVQNAFGANDYPLFRRIYHDSETAFLERPIKIDYFNWTESPTVWKRRFGEKV